MTEEILALAASLGGVGVGELDGLRQCCRQAEGELGTRLRDGVTAEDCAPAFVLGCAWLALADFGLGCPPADFSAGGLTIREQSGGAEALRQRAETVMSPYLKGRGFCFAGVRG